DEAGIGDAGGELLAAEIYGVGKSLDRQAAVVGIFDAHAHAQLLLEEVGPANLDVDDGESGSLQLRQEQRAAGERDRQEQKRHGTHGSDVTEHHARPYMPLSCAKCRASSVVSAPAGSRQRQLPSMVPGVLSRASVPRPRRSCAGMMASCPTEPSASRIRASGMEPGAARSIESTRPRVSSSRL